MSSGFDPDWVVSPGEILEDEMAEGLTREALYAVGIDEAVLLGLVVGELPVDEALAAKIAEATGSSVQLWLNLERNFRDGLAKGKSWPR